MRVRQGASSGTICPTLRTLTSTPTPIKTQVQYHATVLVLTGDRLPSLSLVEARLVPAQTGLHHHIWRRLWERTRGHAPYPSVSSS
ncbi:hypothetical protein Taro_005215 [Colocasia esculenta]|uniref:Uncharacterized protein n=1 Tax=Colocasia esculenta TaxID=4460 RepID=A0A843TP76_COLES|nr:hypothetical protein [Colocasia esculenta]